MNLWTELRRRNVFRVAAAYAVVAWLLLRVGDVASESLGFADWFMPMLFVVLGLGFPVTLLLSWAVEMAPEGIKRTEQTDAFRQRIRDSGMLDYWHEHGWPDLCRPLITRIVSDEREDDFECD